MNLLITAAGIFTNVNKQYINGEWKEGGTGTKAHIVDPYDRSLLAEVVLAGREEVDEAYQSAKAAQKNWAAAPAEEKVKVMENAISILKEHQDRVIDTLVREAGSSRLKATIEVQAALGIMREAMTFPGRMDPVAMTSHIPGKENHIVRKPAGVVGIISPFNFPFHLSIRSIAPAIATGNTVVHKPDLQTAISGGGIIAKIFELAGLPKGVLNVLLTTPAVIGDYFIEHPIPRVISFTGSTPVGRKVGALAGQHLKKAALELGGNNPFVVLEDADIQQAVEAAAFGAFLHQGQICMSINRIFVPRKIHDDFTARLVEKIRSIPYGDPKEPEVIIGPLINENQIEKFLNVVAIAKQEGAHLALEGTRIGNIISPFVFTNVTNQSTVAQTELFGPAVSIIPYDSEEEVLELANDTEFGLSSAVFTADLQKGFQFAQKIESGMTHVNDQTVNDEAEVPFGGEKCSGLGRYNGEWALEEFTTVKWISVQKEARHYPF
ncbi:aldehyde dehydrogenase family protein [Fictibacillus enclensis]|uniref:aldehyde dehydrogenase family protein n=1 Tax=Fictibacillus enclensis TaxID=1017270 RepID=UPI0024BFCC01|nr:aldehyde dehydrogenase family protein [Fictibacillus enclensis]WHY71774.1 aldehyde dehydrogenase family protein [Fictibacillus enclensis]